MRHQVPNRCCAISHILDYKTGCISIKPCYVDCVDTKHHHGRIDIQLQCSWSCTSVNIESGSFIVPLDIRTLAATWTACIMSSHGLPTEPAFVQVTTTTWPWQHHDNEGHVKCGTLASLSSIKVRAYTEFAELDTDWLQEYDICGDWVSRYGPVAVRSGVTRRRPVEVVKLNIIHRCVPSC